MKKLALLIICLSILSYGCGETTNAEVPPEITMAAIVYHIYSSSTYGETYRDVTTSAACPDNMQAVSAGCNCTIIDVYGAYYNNVSAQYISNNAAHCDCSLAGGVMFTPEYRTEVAYVNCAETIYNSGSAP